MKTDKSFISAVVALALLVSCESSFANTRLPVRSEFPPSSAPFSPSRDLTVMHEDLQFDCDSAGCQVDAAYRILSKEPAALKMSFISPSSRVETVTLNGSDAKPGSVLGAKFIDFYALYETAGENFRNIENLVEQASKKQDYVATPEYQQLLERAQLADKEWARLSPMRGHNHVELFGKLTNLPDARSAECQSLVPDLSLPKGWERYLTCLLDGNDLGKFSQDLFGMKQDWELYQFNFDAAILAGENTLQVRYFQPYSFAEPFVAYFRSPPPMHYVSYELWPLKEWRRDPDFKIDLTVRYHNPPHGFLYTKRDGLSVSAGQFKDNQNGGLIRNASTLSPDTLEAFPNDTLVYKISLRGNISDRLFIITGE